MIEIVRRDWRPQLQAAAAATPPKVRDVVLPLWDSRLRVLLPSVALFFLVRCGRFPPTTFDCVRKTNREKFSLIGGDGVDFRRRCAWRSALVIAKGPQAADTMRGVSLVTR